MNRYQTILDRIQGACVQSERDPSTVRLIAVSKGQDSAAVRALYDAGQKIFGENYVDELLQKADQLKDCAITWVYIGTVQSNKVQRLMTVASEIQTVSSAKQLRYIARYAEEAGKAPFPIFLEFNMWNEVSKGGVGEVELRALASEIVRSYPQLDLRGVMAIPPIDAQASEYKELRAKTLDIGKGELSLGMSDDLEAAIEAGSTCIRIGRALMGERIV